MEGSAVKVTLRLQNVHAEGCVRNIEMALKLIEGVRAVHVHRDQLTADVLYEAPATPIQMREQLMLGGYLAES